MLKLDQLIKDSVKEDVDSEKIKNNETLTNKLFDIADKVTEELNPNKERKNINEKKIKVKNVTFSLSLEAEDLFEEIIRTYRKSTGEVVKKSHILIAAIKYFSKLDDNSIVAEITNQQFAEMGRPKK